MPRPCVEPGPRYAKGHCCGDGFLLLLDPDDRLCLSEAAVRALCDPHGGLGGDALLRLVRTRRGRLPGRPRGDWFADVRDPDGFPALTCGPGLGLVARYLTAADLARPGRIWLGTRAGDARATVDAGGRTTVELPPARVLGPSAVTLDGHTFEGTTVSLGGLHLVCPTELPVPGLDLTHEPRLDLHAFPGTTGVMVPDVTLSFVNVLPSGRLRVRVHRPRVGRPPSCGTTVCAAAAVVQHTAGRRQGTTDVESPSGPLSVTLGTNAPTLLTGATAIAAEGVLDARWLAAL
ncbi:diaminopimelate epimerase [Streptomyces sp. NPDC026206]|uniref:diaminopimelate epimerase n=1 Tax=Streptomyces sp. NPDC026206 TaxID=3157089 RepID=UPI003406A96B